MFERLKRALDSALASLESESDENVRDGLDRLLAGMRAELVEARARIPELEELIVRLERDAQSEERRAADCERRARLAVKAGDDETAQVALRFEARHRDHAAVLQQKAEATRAELAEQRRAADEMTAQLKSAMARRESLGVQVRRTRATERLRGGRRSPADDFDRVSERIEREGDLAAAERELDDELGGAPAGGPGRGRTRARFEEMEESAAEAVAEERLRELKRRMAAESGDSAGA